MRKDTTVPDNPDEIRRQVETEIQRQVNNSVPPDAREYVITKALEDYEALEGREEILYPLAAAAKIARYRAIDYIRSPAYRHPTSFLSELPEWRQPSVTPMEHATDGIALRNALELLSRDTNPRMARLGELLIECVDKLEEPQVQEIAALLGYSNATASRLINRIKDRILGAVD